MGIGLEVLQVESLQRHHARICDAGSGKLKVNRDAALLSQKMEAFLARCAHRQVGGRSDARAEHPGWPGRQAV